MNKVLPLVSVCLPTFNGEKYILEALNCIKNQTYRNIELIISDDDSKDQTLIIIQDFIRDFDFPVFIFNHIPKGIGANWNNCIEKANGEFIKFLFQDDLLEPTCIEALIKPLLECNKVGLSFCRRKIIYNKTNKEDIEWIKKYRNLHTSWTNLKPIQNGTKLLNDINFLENPKNKVGEPIVVLLRKEVFSNIGYFNNDLKQSLDYEFWYRVFTKYKVAFVDEELASFRLHVEQASSVNNKIKIDDYELYPHIIYKTSFKFLSINNKVKLFLKYHPIGNVISRIKRKWQKL